VMLRCFSLAALLGTLLALGFGFQPMTTHAASVNPNASTTTADYRLTTSTTIPVADTNIQGPQVVAMITPTGGVVPPTLSDGKQGSPLTVLPDSSGFDPTNLIVVLRDTTSASGQTEQQLGLVFFGKGLQSGGVLHFALSIDKALASNPPVLASFTPGLSITLDPPPNTTPPTNLGSGDGGSSSGGGTGSGNEVPEPLSVILWSTLFVGVTARNRILSRRKAG
jgi:hypothetical protein